MALYSVTIHGRTHLNNGGVTSGINQIAESNTAGSQSVSYGQSTKPSGVGGGYPKDSGSNKTSTWYFYTDSNKNVLVTSKSVTAYATTSRESLGNSWSYSNVTVTFGSSTTDYYGDLYAYTSTKTWDTYDEGQSIKTPSDRDGKAKSTRADKNAYTVTGGICSTSPSNAGNGNVYEVSKAPSFTKFGNATFYPQLTPNPYTITLKYNYNGAPADGSVSVTYGKACSNLTTPTRTGYLFSSGNTEADGSGTTYTTSTTYTTIGNLILFAQGTPVNCTLIANSNNGIITSGTGGTIASGGATANKLVVFNTEYGELPVATRTNYQFDGGYTSASGGSQVLPTTIMNKVETSGTNIYAHGTEGVKVIFDLQGGYKDDDQYPEEQSGGHITKIYRIMKQNTNNNIDMGPPTRVNYLFDGYYTQPNGKGIKIYEGKSPTSVYGIESTGYWQSNKWVNTNTNLVLYAYGQKANIFVYNNNSGKAVRPYRYNKGGKKVTSGSGYNDEGKPGAN